MHKLSNISSKNFNIAFGTYCHRMPERSFFYKGKQFPVCARCTGFYLGYFVLPFFLLYPLSILVSVALLIPAFLDGFTQALCKRESTNLIRVITGFLAGVGFMSLLFIAGMYIGIFILYLFS